MPDKTIKNVVFIMLDTLQHNYLGCYGNPWIKTPHLDRLAAEGTLFTHCYSEGLPTIPTRTTWFTGRFTFPFRGWQRLEPKDLTLAEVLWNKGITSALITDVYHMHKPSMAFERGFDYTEHIRGQEADPWIVDPAVDVSKRLAEVYKGDGKDRSVKAQLEQYLRNIHWWQGEEDTFVARVMRAGATWLERQRKRDCLFLWLDCFDPHEPWDPPEPYRSLYIDPAYPGQDIIHPLPGKVEGYLTPAELHHVTRLYAGKVSLCDRWIGWFLDRLKAMGLYDDTLIIYTSDHGEPFGEHGYLKKAEPGLYEDLVHIPLIVRHPGGLGAGRRLDALVETTELFPTVLEAFQVKSPGRLHGHSLLPLMAGQQDKIRDYAYMGYYRQSWRISDHAYSFHLYLDKTRAPELYDLRQDPGEQNNIITQQPLKAQEMELALHRFVAELR